jgi:hypothetical protein
MSASQKTISPLKRTPEKRSAEPATLDTDEENELLRSDDELAFTLE